VIHKDREGKKMKATYLINTLMILFLSIQSTMLSAAPTPRASTLSTNLMVVTAQPMTVRAGDRRRLLVHHRQWRVIGPQMKLKSCRCSSKYLCALAANKIDRRVVLDGYRFRYIAGSIGDKKGEWAR
jgi:hypothetical protein